MNQSQMKVCFLHCVEQVKGREYQHFFTENIGQPYEHIFPFENRSSLEQFIVGQIMESKGAGKSKIAVLGMDYIRLKSSLIEALAIFSHFNKLTKESNVQVQINNQAAADLNSLDIYKVCSSCSKMTVRLSRARSNDVLTVIFWLDRSWSEQKFMASFETQDCRAVAFVLDDNHSEKLANLSEAAQVLMKTFDQKVPTLSSNPSLIVEGPGKHSQAASLEFRNFPNFDTPVLVTAASHEPVHILSPTKPPSSTSAVTSVKKTLKSIINFKECQQGSPKHAETELQSQPDTSKVRLALPNSASCKAIYQTPNIGFLKTPEFDDKRSRGVSFGDPNAPLTDEVESPATLRSIPDVVHEEDETGKAGLVLSTKKVSSPAKIDKETHDVGVLAKPIMIEKKCQPISTFTELLKKQEHNIVELRRKMQEKNKLCQEFIIENIHLKETIRKNARIFPNFLSALKRQYSEQRNITEHKEDRKSSEKKHVEKDKTKVSAYYLRRDTGTGKHELELGKKDSSQATNVSLNHPRKLFDPENPDFFFKPKLAKKNSDASMNLYRRREPVSPTTHNYQFTSYQLSKQNLVRNFHHNTKNYLYENRNSSTREEERPRGAAGTIIIMHPRLNSTSQGKISISHNHSSESGSRRARKLSNLYTDYVSSPKTTKALTVYHDLMNHDISMLRSMALRAKSPDMSLVLDSMQRRTNTYLSSGKK